MEFLKEVFGEEALTYDQLSERLRDNGKIKLGNLAGGAYVGREKMAVLEAERDDLQKRLSEASAKLEGYDPEWRDKAQKAQEEAQKQIEQMRFDFALDEELRKSKAKNVKAVRALLDRDALKWANGEIVGLKEQVEKIQAENDYLFHSDKPTPAINVPGKPAPPKPEGKAYLDSFYQHNPFYKK